MGNKKYKPMTPGRRNMTVADNSALTKKAPERSLVISSKRGSGRNNVGRITVRHKGGGAKKKIRMVDFKRKKFDIVAKVAAIEYDPTRSAHIALLFYVDGEKAYILCPQDLKVGDSVIASEKADIRPGNHLPLRQMPLGTALHNLEVKLGKGGQLIRSAGTAGQLVAKEGLYAQVRLPSGEVRKIHRDCWATIGQVGNIEYENITIGKAGRTRWMGIRPTVRGVVMNPIDHPHGGGEGKSGQGNPHPVTPWGVPTKGYKTRKNRRTDKFIVRRRKK